MNVTIDKVKNYNFCVIIDLFKSNDNREDSKSISIIILHKGRRDYES